MLYGFLSLAVVLVATVRASNNIDGPSVSQVTKPIGLAEGPHWDGRKNILYFVSILDGEVYAYHYHSDILTKITLNGQVTPVVPSRKNPNLLLVGVDRSIVAVEWDGKNKQGNQAVVTTVNKQIADSRFNDGKADKQGRLWWGTTGRDTVNPGQAFLYKITKHNINDPTVAISHVTNSNGLAWNKANDKFYYIDTPSLKVVEYDYSDENATISSGRTVFDINDHKTNITGVPDGMTIDDEDNLYVALYGGGAIIKINPKTGELLNIIAIPSRDVTSAMFGGPNLDILFVTTSKISLTPEELLQWPAAGSVFAVKNLNAKGLPAFTADIIDSIPSRDYGNH
ncbi:unnamed protein product [Psylliodes chrysocephalus]|uniref:SMP-30/Gluconolactonase/LRE-like region domain-containing protein n=1 Tax=Psylliodes chrysocephalus TaxID=3402493 RepID=A0A9P0CFW8_9CUCU|nr:unnamed protein product [Psylliodes chrysocephala]